MMRKRKSSRRREQMAFMEFSSELTRSDRAAQCLEKKKERERERFTGLFLLQPTDF